MTESSPAPAPPTGDVLTVLLKEYDALRELYTHMESSAASTFNFYLTLVSSAFGAVVFILQFGGGNTSRPLTQLLVSALLLFGAAVGSVMLSAIVGRYGHMARYAAGIDALRRHLLTRLEVSTPPEFDSLTAAAPQPVSRTTWWLTALFPSGSYQFFMGFFNSLLLALAVWLTVSAGGMAGRALIAALLVFGLSFTAYNIYGRYMMRRIVNSLGVRIDTGRDLPFLAGKQ